MILRRAATAFLLVSLVALPCLSLCSGWTASAGMRMACCTGLDNHDSQTAADLCCAFGEHRQNAESTGRLLAAAIQVQGLTQHTIAFFSSVPALQSSGVDVGGRDHVASTSDTHLLLSVFLI